MTPNVCVVFPTANLARAQRAEAAWRDRRYAVRVGVDPEFGNRYPGYFVAVNEMIRKAAAIYDYEIIVAAADDLFPDQTHTADDILAMFRERFPDGYGVLQPCGDDLPGTTALCGSPWFGRAWCERAYGGMGPFYAGYRHFFGDEELLYAASAQNAVWQCPDLTQFHDHWIRKGGPPKTDYQTRNDRHWEHDKWLYEARKAAGWPGSAPCS